MRTNYVRVTCGCEFWIEPHLDEIHGNFVIRPCQPQCWVYLYVLEESLSQGKMIEPRLDSRLQGPN